MASDGADGHIDVKAVDGDRKQGPVSLSDDQRQRSPSVHDSKHGAKESDADNDCEEVNATTSDPDWASDFSELSEDRRRKRHLKWNRPTPEGVRRSKRHRGEVSVHDGHDDVASSRAASVLRGNRPSETGNESSFHTSMDNEADPQGENEAETKAFLEGLVVSPNQPLIRPRKSEEDVEKEIQELRAMWEMAAIIDFLHLFREQLKLRAFTAAELERVLVTSAGDEGLLADIHIDLMKGISSKSDVKLTNWQVQLANKIRFHWKNLSDGSPCPFKPEKYLEAPSYAVLSSPQRVRSLHFLCCVRCDREDIQAYIAEAELRKEVADAQAIHVSETAKTRERSVNARVTRAAKAEAMEEQQHPIEPGVDAFRRHPIGEDEEGALYYYFDMVETYGPRLYRESPTARSNIVEASQAERSASESAIYLTKADGAIRSSSETDVITKEDDEGDEEEEEEEDNDGDDSGIIIEGAYGARSSYADPSKMSKKSKERALRKMPRVRGKSKLPPPPPPGKWEVIASTFEEFRSEGERLARSSHPQERALGGRMLNELLPKWEEHEAAEARRRRTNRRLKTALGVGNEVEEAIGDSRRVRRSRSKVDYTFDDFDNEVRAAIRRSNRRAGSPGEDERRSRRGTTPLDDAEAVRAGMRRGRSASVADPSLRLADTELNERALRRAAAASRAASHTTEDTDADEREHRDATSENVGRWMLRRNKAKDGIKSENEELATVGYYSNKASDHDTRGSSRRPRREAASKAKARFAEDFVYGDDIEKEISRETRPPIAERPPRPSIQDVTRTMKATTREEGTTTRRMVPPRHVDGVYARPVYSAMFDSNHISQPHGILSLAAGHAQRHALPHDIREQLELGTTNSDGVGWRGAMGNPHHVHNPMGSFPAHPSIPTSYLSSYDAVAAQHAASPQLQQWHQALERARAQQHLQERDELARQMRQLQALAAAREQIVDLQQQDQQQQRTLAALVHARQQMADAQYGQQPPQLPQQPALEQQIRDFMLRLGQQQQQQQQQQRAIPGPLYDSNAEPSTGMRGLSLTAGDFQAAYDAFAHQIHDPTQALSTIFMDGGACPSRNGHVGVMRDASEFFHQSGKGL